MNRIEFFSTENIYDLTSTKNVKEVNNSKTKIFNTSAPFNNNSKKTDKLFDVSFNNINKKQELQIVEKFYTEDYDWIIYDGGGV